MRINHLFLWKGGFHFSDNDHQEEEFFSVIVMNYFWNYVQKIGEPQKEILLMFSEDSIRRNNVYNEHEEENDNLR